MPRDEIEVIKIGIYMHLWESFHRSDSLREFEDRYVLTLAESERFHVANRKAVIRDVLIDFYAANGVELNVKFSYSTMELHKRVINEQENIFLSFMIRELERYSPKMHKDENRDDLYYFDEKFSAHIMKVASDACDNAPCKVDIVKCALRGIFGLDSRDAVFLINGKLFVRYFRIKDTKKERRFNGLPEDEVEIVYARRPEDEYRKIIGHVVTRLLEDDLDLRRVDNFTFHANYLRLLQNRLKMVFNPDFELEDVLNGFVNYVIRRQYEFALMKVCQRIIELICENNGNIKEFVSFYDGKEIVYNKKKVKKTDILIDGKRWSYNPIYNALGQKKNARMNLDKKVQDIKAIGKEIEHKKQTIIEIQNTCEEKRQLVEKFQKETDELTGRISALRDSFTTAQKELNSLKNRDAKEEVAQKVEKMRNTLQELSKEDHKLLNSRDNAAKEYERSEINLLEAKKQLEAYERNQVFEQNKIQNMQEKFLPLQEQENQIRLALFSALLKFRI